MISIINRSRFLRKTVQYNERKVSKNTATFIDAGFYLQDPARLTIQQKLERLTNRILLNERSKVNVLTCSLSFGESQRLPLSRLRQISAFFLKQIGFDRQPYLVYEHHDSSRQHVHIVSTLIRADGSRIEDYHTSKKLRMRAEKATQLAFGLKGVGYFRSKTKHDTPGAPLDAKPSPVGKEKIRAVLDQVIEGYKFSSLSEFNAVLRQFGVHALKGSKNSRLFQNQGLVYRTLDQRGIRSCRAIKASSLDARSTLKALTLQFEQNKGAQDRQMDRLKNTLDLTLLNAGARGLTAVAGLLENQGVKMHLCKEAADNELILTYIDNRSKCAFDARLLGENYGLKALLRKCAQRSVIEKSFTPAHASMGSAEQNDFLESLPEFTFLFAAAHTHSKVDLLLHDLIMPVSGFNAPVFELRKPSKKRKRKSSH